MCKTFGKMRMTDMVAIARISFEFVGGWRECGALKVIASKI